MSQSTLGAPWAGLETLELSEPSMAQRQCACALGNDLTLEPEPVIPDQPLVPQGFVSGKQVGCLRIDPEVHQRLYCGPGAVCRVLPIKAVSY